MNAPLSSAPSRVNASCTLAGNEAILDISGALYLPQDRLLVVADLHLEKGTSGRKRGIFLPPYDSVLTLKLLGATVARYEPLSLILLGDSFHDADAPLRLEGSSLDALKTLAQTTELIWVTGNHDPDIPKSIANTCVTELSCAGLHFTHIPQANVEAPQVSGHLHPVVTVTGRGRTIRRRCFASDGVRMILPAFGAYTGGLNIRDKAFDGMFKSGGLMTHVIGEQGVYALPVTAKNR
jgi:uncharacterized protein